MATQAKKLAKHSQLQDKLTESFPLHAARAEFTVLPTGSLLKVQGVGFERLAQGFGNDVEPGSSLRPIQRFSARSTLDIDLMARLSLKLLPVGGPHALSLDRANRSFGNRNPSILFLAATHRGVSLPGTVLGDQRGDSDQQGRIALPERFMRLFGREAIARLAADRELVGQDRRRFLVDNRIRFFMRLRGNMPVRIPRKGTVKARWLFNGPPLGTFRQQPGIVRVTGLSE